MKEEILVYKTDEISDDLWDKIVSGFNECFDSKTTKENLLSHYRSNIFGFAFHAVKINDEGEVMGYNSMIPYLYIHEGREIKVANSGGSYVKKAFRKDFMMFHDIMRVLIVKLREEGFKMTVGVSNKNSFLYSIKINKDKYVADLPFYILPLKISKILKKPNLKFANIFSLAFSWGLIGINSISSLIYNPKENLDTIRIETSEKFYNTRFHNSSRYIHHKYKGMSFFFRLYDEEEIKTAYIMDFRDKNGFRSGKALNKLVSYISKNFNPDVIMFVGTLNLKQFQLLKVPKKFEPQRMPLSYHIIDTSDKSLFETASNIKNWDFSLMNFDVR